MVSHLSIILENNGHTKLINENRKKLKLNESVILPPSTVSQTNRICRKCQMTQIDSLRFNLPKNSNLKCQNDNQKQLYEFVGSIKRVLAHFRISFDEKLYIFLNDMAFAHFNDLFNFYYLDIWYYYDHYIE